MLLEYVFVTVNGRRTLLDVGKIDVLDEIGKSLCGVRANDRCIDWTEELLGEWFHSAAGLVVIVEWGDAATNFVPRFLTVLQSGLAVAEEPTRPAAKDEALLHAT